MFFTEWGHTVPTLERAYLDGSERMKLVVEKIVYPSGVAVDMPTQSVYWVDTYIETIEKINYDGTNRKTVYRNSQVCIKIFNFIFLIILNSEHYIKVKITV